MIVERGFNICRYPTYDNYNLNLGRQKDLYASKASTFYLKWYNSNSK